MINVFAFFFICFSICCELSLILWFTKDLYPFLDFMNFLVLLLSNLLNDRQIICISGIFGLWLDDIESSWRIFAMVLLLLQVSVDVVGISEEYIEASICVPFHVLAICE